jgi:hypothetical protein
MVSRVDQSETGLLVTINVVMESLEVLKIVLTDDNKNTILKYIKICKKIRIGKPEPLLVSLRIYS